MTEITVTTQAELDEAAKQKNTLIKLCKGYFNVGKLADGTWVDVLAGGFVNDVRDGGRVNAKIDTPEKWCEFYGVPIADRIVVIFKGTDENYQSSVWRRLHAGHDSRCAGLGRRHGRVWRRSAFFPQARMDAGILRKFLALRGLPRTPFRYALPETDGRLSGQNQGVGMLCAGMGM